MKNILVTGAGAVLGQGIIRCLIEVKDQYYIHTADPDYKSSGHWLGQKAHIVKRADNPEFMNSVESIIRSEKIDLILIGTDVELLVFSQHKSRLKKKYGTIVLVSDPKVISIADDKFLTSNFLKNNNFRYPISFMSSDQQGIIFLKNRGTYPYIAKPIDGARSVGLELVQSQDDLDRLSSYENNLVIQEYIPDIDGEYTSGCLVYNNKCQAVITLKRDLKDGNTSRAYYDKKYDIYNSFISEVAEKLGVEGPCNFQFRIKNGQPVIFEINARFSGTTPIRNFFGFNEVLACVEYYLNNSGVKAINLKPGVIMRSWSDIFVDENQLKKLSADGSLKSPKSIYHPFKK